MLAQKATPPAATEGEKKDTHPDYSEARAFLQRLDPIAEQFCFQTFDDDKNRKSPELVRIINAQQTEATYDALARLNAQGAGIYVTVNETDGRRRKAGNIIRVRAVFVDLDGAPLEPVLEAGLTPHIVVESSPGRWHVYWLVADCLLHQFRAVQKALIAKFNSDENVHDLPRVLRLPGFLHRKGESFRTRLVTEHCSDSDPYAIADIVAKLNLDIAPRGQQSTGTNGTANEDLGSGGNVPPERIEKGGRNAAVLRHILHLRGMGMPTSLIRSAAHDFNKARCVPPLDAAEVDDLANRFAHQAPGDTAPDWPEPKPINSALPTVPPFNTTMLPEVIRAHVEDMADLMQCPAEYIAVPLIVALAATLGNGWAIAPKAQDMSWLVVPVLWGGIVGRPSTKKSPAMAQALAPLSILEADMDADFQLKLARYVADKIAYNVAEKKVAASAKKGEPVAMPPEPQKPHPERLIVNDSTYQKLTDLLQWSPKGVLVTVDELVGLLESLRADGQEAARAFYLTAWNGNQTYRVDRIERGSSIIKRLAVWIVGGIVPGRLDAYVRQAVHGGNGDDGLLQRFQLLVWPDPIRNFRIVDRHVDMIAYAAVEETFKRLRKLDPVTAGAAVGLDSRPAYLHFTNEAQALFDQFRQRWETRLRNGDRHPALESHFGKYGSLIASLALVTHLADGGLGPVDRTALEKAIEWVLYLIPHARRVYSSATNAAAASAKALADKIKSGKLVTGFTAREVQRKGWSSLAAHGDVQVAVESLCDADWIRRVEQRTAGNSTTIYVVNPRLAARSEP